MKAPNLTLPCLMMASILQVFRSKPNPFGKDKSSSGTPKPEQLLGEWVDIKNVGTEPVRFSSMELRHVEFNGICEALRISLSYWSGGGNETLNPGQILRVYTGRKEDDPLMKPEDRGQIEWRAFAGKSNFVLNNRCGDTIRVDWLDAQRNAWKDEASYAPDPPEGAILTRQGSRLV